jgi:hypothetical protein
MHHHLQERGNPRGIILRHPANPWEPWSEPIEYSILAGIAAPATRLAQGTVSSGTFLCKRGVLAGDAAPKSRAGGRIWRYRERHRDDAVNPVPAKTRADFFTWPGALLVLVNVKCLDATPPLPHFSTVEAFVITSRITAIFSFSMLQS